MSTATSTASAYGAFTAPATLTLQRRLPGPIERVWACLTDGELRRQWLAGGAMTLRPDATFELTWRNDELSASAAERPEDAPAVSHATCRIIEVEPPRRLRFAWPGAGDVTFALESQGAEVILTLTHRDIPDPGMAVRVGAGWHMHLDILVARATGAPPPSFWSGWLRLRHDYERRLAA